MNVKLVGETKIYMRGCGKQQVLGKGVQGGVTNKV
jgi:hypothetical protein